MVAGFDMGNSPFSFMEERIAGKDIAFTTTNGTQAISKSNEADLVIIGSFLNISSVINFLMDQQKDTVIVCAGWKGKFNLEDTLFAGAVASMLPSFTEVDDATLTSKYLYQIASSNLYAFLKNSSHFNRLRKLNIKKDIEFCLTQNQYAILPVVKDGVIVNE